MMPIDDVRTAIDDFDAAAPLASLNGRELHHLSVALARANDDIDRCLKDHHEKRPSVGWMLLSVASGFGGVPLTEVTLAGVALTVAGVLGAGKSLYDHGAHLVVEQQLLALLWGVEERAQQLRLEVSRRGLFA